LILSRERHHNKVHCRISHFRSAQLVHIDATSLLVDVVGRASVIEMLASQYPDVNFIIPHLGSFADTAGVRRFDYIAQAVERAGAHKVLFGSDGPWLYPSLELYRIRLLRLSPAEDSLILGGNILRLIRRTPIPRRRGHAKRERPAPWARRANGSRPSNAANGLTALVSQQEHEL
jgi:hypothetical protein